MLYWFYKWTKSNMWSGAWNKTHFINPLSNRFLASTVYQSVGLMIWRLWVQSRVGTIFLFCFFSSMLAGNSNYAKTRMVSMPDCWSVGLGFWTHRGLFSTLQLFCHLISWIQWIFWFKIEKTQLKWCSNKRSFSIDRIRGRGGGTRDACSPLDWILFIFMEFGEKLFKIIGWCHHYQLLGKILDPPLIRISLAAQALIIQRAEH